MGQKANPNAIRLGINRDWDASWYPSNKKNFANWLVEDKKIRTYIEQFERRWFIGKLVIERREEGKIKLIIHTSRPGAVLGKEGKNIADLTLNIKKLLKQRNLKLEIDVVEIKNPDLNAQLIANEIAIALENRASFRITQKKMLFRVMKAGAKGIKTQVSGRLNGVDMARSEGYSRGVVPLQTFRNDIDFATANAHTTYGILGVKVWISKDEVLRRRRENFNRDDRDRRPRHPRQDRQNQDRSARPAKVEEGS